ncbi:MAG: M23 family metallopeptidase [Candidatus Zixiibacteriota bacterium]
MWLLEWLVARWLSVYDWFGDAYWTYRGRVASLPATLYAIGLQIQSVYTTMLGAIWGRISEFYNAHILPYLRLLDSGIAQVRAGIGDLWNKINAQVIDYYDRLLVWRNRIIAWVKDTYDHIITGLRLIVEHITNQVIPTLLVKLDHLFAFSPWLQSIRELLTPDWLRNFLVAWNKTKQTMTLIADNPAGYILGILEQYLLPFLAYALGYALGSTQYDLPPKPVFGAGGGGALIPLPEGTGELGRPLRSLYVSGYTYSDTHRGVDFGAVRGEPVYASHDGVVAYAGWSQVGYGLYIDLSSAHYWTRYAHLDSLLVRPGQSVQRGEIIGNANSSGNSTGDHLHYELRVNGVYVNPVLYLQ